MNDNAGLYRQKLCYNRHTGPYQSLSLPWWVRMPKEVYGPVHGCDIAPLICGEEVFGAIAEDFKQARRCIDIISWGFDPGMVLVRGSAAQSGQRAGELLKEVAGRKEHPVRVRIVIWHDDVAAQALMKNLPGYYGLQFPAIGCRRNRYYSEDHQFYNAEWFSMAIAGELPNIEFRVRSVPLSLLPSSLSGEDTPGGLPALAGKCYATHHQKMILVDYLEPRRAVGYVMGHNFVTDFWDTRAHLFQDPRRERFYNQDPAKAWRQGADLASDGAPFIPGGQPSERDILAKESAVRAYLANSQAAKPYQDVSCRLRGRILCSLNHNFSQAWQESERPRSLAGELASWAALPVRAAETVAKQLRPLVAPASGAGTAGDGDGLPAAAFALKNGRHSVQLLRTQPLHREKAIKECYANLTRQMGHYMFIQNQYIQYQPWAEHVKECVQRQRAAGCLNPIYIFILTSTPESDGMDLPTYDVAAGLGLSEAMKAEHAAALQLARQGKANMPLTPEELQKSGINVLMGSMWTCAAPPQVGKLRACDYEEIYIHAKVAIVDDAAFTLGSANLNVRSMALDSELNMLSDAADVAYGLRCELFSQCTNEPGPEQFASMEKTFNNWQDLMQKNKERKVIGNLIVGQLMPFHVARQPGRPLV